jgi:hypothetical protein
MGAMSDMEFSYEGVHAVAIRGLGGGEVQLRSSDRDGLVNGRMSSSDPGYLERATVAQSGDQLYIEFPSMSGQDGPHVDIDLEVPEGIAFEVNTGSADVHADVPLGPTKINTGSGDINLAEVSDARANTGSGDISIEHITGGAAQLNSGSGDISVDETAAAIQARTASGDLIIHRLAGALRANTASGDISVPSTTGSLEARTASGSIEVGVADGMPAWLELSSVSGEVNIDLDASQQPEDGEPFVTVNATTASGDVNVYRA